MIARVVVLFLVAGIALAQELPDPLSMHRFQQQRFLAQHERIVEAWKAYDAALDRWAGLMIQERTILDVRNQKTTTLGLLQAKAELVAATERLKVAVSGLNADKLAKSVRDLPPK
jgi:hypothetical protein